MVSFVTSSTRIIETRREMMEMLKTKEQFSERGISTPSDRHRSHSQGENEQKHTPYKREIAESNISRSMTESEKEKDDTPKVDHKTKQLRIEAQILVIISWGHL